MPNGPEYYVFFLTTIKKIIITNNIKFQAGKKKKKKGKKKKIFQPRKICLQLKTRRKCIRWKWKVGVRQ